MRKLEACGFVVHNIEVTFFNFLVRHVFFLGKTNSAVV